MAVYDQWLTEDGLKLLRGWRRAGLSLNQIANKVGVNHKTICQWELKYPEIRKALYKGKELCDFDVEEALIKTMEGHYVEDIMTDIWQDGKGENAKTTKTHIHKIKRWVEPNITAMIFYLKCKAGWQEKGQEDQTAVIDKIGQMIASVEKTADKQAKEAEAEEPLPDAEIELDGQADSE